ncbi:ATP-dependent helicase [Pedosphaera parvula]|uniref:DNA 3'-5' helicase n=1 Tax=Pedosphaera parvula (strain Ellin514) TaxID=320771 RepID=B9XNK2_PEDPL|nr:ATP-dependent helicase [Pedosphaera parvula]EEF58542.1 UvrD/REP helicase [Pedosphaera parvula Ellin514]
MSREYVLHPFNAPVELHVDYARELNEQQHAAVTAPPGPSLVIAGAGSGKTRTLTFRVGFLLEQGIPADRILLLTFTNKAAREMMRRVSDLLGQDLPSLWGGTFHSIGNRILRQHAPLLGYQRDFSIMDREDAKDLVDACVAEAEIDVKATRFPKADVLADIFSLGLNTQRSIPEVLAQEYDYFENLAPQIADIKERYILRKKSTNAMDFDDLLELWLKLLKEHPEVREHYQRRFQFILVDEYQDTNALQSELIDLLAARHHNVMVVGDDAQSIYAWRGANFQNIIKFPERYSEARVYKIETNYRSTPEILNLANAAISANVKQFEKQLTPARKSGLKPVLVPCMTASEQASFVAQRMLELREEGVNMNQMAVLYRSHFHALELQLELTRRNIPFSITSGIRFFEQAHIKDVAAYIKLVNNPRDELAFKRLVQLLPGVGGKGADKLWARFQSAFKVIPENLQADARDTLLPSETSTKADRNPVATALQASASAVPKKTAVAWAQFVATISQLETEPVRGKTDKMIRLIVEAGYDEHLQENYANYRNRLDDIEQLALFAQQFSTTEEFLAQLALLSNLEAETDEPANNDNEQVKLSTIHQAKGLEFDVVFIIMLCDGLFPSARSLDTAEGEEEERRLLYVAITRARNELYLSYPLIRMMPGGSGDAMQQPSRFLSELPKESLDEWNLKTINPYG